MPDPPRDRALHRTTWALPHIERERRGIGECAGMELQILSGIAMSPALAARFPRASRLFGGHQSARSLHFLGLVAFLVFFVAHG